MSKSFTVTLARIDQPDVKVVRHYVGRTIHEAIAKAEQAGTLRDDGPFECVLVERVWRDGE